MSLVLSYHYDVLIDGLLGIGLDGKPSADYQTIINWINQYRKQFTLVKSSASMYPADLMPLRAKIIDDTAIKMNKTLCLIGRKVGLHIGVSRRLC